MSADGENENHNRGDGSDGGDAKQAGGPSMTESDASARSQDVPARKPQGQPGAGASGGLLPNKAAEDDPRRWGDQPGSYDHDAWLKEQRPPHWG